MRFARAYQVDVHFVGPFFCRLRAIRGRERGRLRGGLRADHALLYGAIRARVSQKVVDLHVLTKIGGDVEKG
jgi:hypothetical protein